MQHSREAVKLATTAVMTMAAVAGPMEHPNQVEAYNPTDSDADAEGEEESEEEAAAAEIENDGPHNALGDSDGDAEIDSPEEEEDEEDDGEDGDVEEATPRIVRTRKNRAAVKRNADVALDDEESSAAEDDEPDDEDSDDGPAVAQEWEAQSEVATTVSAEVANRNNCM